MDPLRKGDIIGPGLVYGGNMDTGEGDPFGLHEQVFNTLLEDTARQIREQGGCGVIKGDQVCLYDRPCRDHEPELYSAREVGWVDRFVRWWRSA